MTGGEKAVEDRPRKVVDCRIREILIQRRKDDGSEC